MSALSAVLEEFFRVAGLTQIAFAADKDLDRGTLNRAVRGSVAIGEAAASKIIRALPAEWQGKALAGWLTDQTPSDLRSHINILANGLTVAADERQLPVELTPALRSAILWLAEAALTHREIRDVVLNLFRALSRPAAGIRSSDMAFSMRRGKGAPSAANRAERVERALQNIRELAGRSDSTLEMLEDYVQISAGQK